MAKDGYFISAKDSHRYWPFQFVKNLWKNIMLKFELSVKVGEGSILNCLCQSSLKRVFNLLVSI